MNKVLYVDVTNTWFTDLQTGIQRVVRGIAENLGDCESDIKLVVFADGAYSVLPDSAFKGISNLYTSRLSGNERVRRRFFLSALGPYLALKRFLPKLLSKFVLDFRFIKKIRRYLKRQKVGPTNEQFTPEGSVLLILDLFVEKDHIQYIKDLHDEHSMQLVYFAYDLMPMLTNFWTEAERTKFAGYFELAKMSYKIWSISEATQNDVKNELVGNELNQRFQYKWLPPTGFPICSHGFVEKSRLAGSEYLLMVGSFAPIKNHLGLLKAIKDLKLEGLSIPKIALVGGFDQKNSELESSIREVTELGISVEKFVGIPNCCIGDLYKYADFTVLPSFIEGFGLPIVESLSFGVPVITSDSASMGELLSLPGTLGFSHDGTPTLKEVLKKVLSSQHILDKLRLEAEGNQENLGTWAAYAKSLEHSIFEETDN